MYRQAKEVHIGDLLVPSNKGCSEQTAVQKRNIIRPEFVVGS